MKMVSMLYGSRACYMDFSDLLRCSNLSSRINSKKQNKTKINKNNKTKQKQQNKTK